MSRAVNEAKQVAAMLRRCGYPEAEAAPEYCIDAEIGMDRFYTYTVSVWAGPHQPETMRPFYRKLMDKLGIKT